jgi:tetratricopeptide (TPR) repeat protein
VIGACNQALRADPRQAEVLVRRGLARHQLGDLAAAAADYSAALAVRPEFPEAFNNRGAARQALRDWSGALADYDAALRLRPDYAEALDNRGGLHYLLWHHDQAAADLTRALDLYRKAGAAPAVLCRLHVHRGDALYHAGQAGALPVEYRRAFALDADLAARLVVERLAKDAAANYRVLLANCNKHLIENPGDHLVHARRGLVALLTGQDGDAQLDFDQFYKKRPPNPVDLLPKLIEAAREYRGRHGTVVSGDTVGVAPPALG